MRHLFFLLTFFALSIISCSESPADAIDVDQIKTPCDCSNAVKILTDEALSELKKFDNDLEKLEEDEASIAHYEKNGKKLKAVFERCKRDLNFKKSDYEKCPSYKAAQKNMEQLWEL